MRSISPAAPRERPWRDGTPPAPPDDDNTAWLVTFSDLVLQLFAFVLVGTVLGNAHHAAPLPTAPTAAARQQALARVSEQVLAVPIVPPPAAPAEAAPAPQALAAAAPPEDAAGPSPAPDDASPLSHAAALEDELRTLAGGSDAVTVRVHAADAVLTLNDTVAFPSGSADLLPGALPVLGAIRTLIASLPGFTVQVEGHTDDVQIHTAAFPSNLELSLARAARVARELAAGDPALLARTAAAGFGEHHPVSSNADEHGRARNRRVEIRLVRRDAAAGEAPTADR